MIWKILRWGVLIFFISLYLILFYALNFLRPYEYIGCDEFTGLMNGGIHPFNGTNHRVELCGLATEVDVRLRVFTMNGELLAERYLHPIEERQSSLSYGTNYIIYHNNGNAEFMPIPPSHWEWIRARLPRVWP